MKKEFFAILATLLPTLLFGNATPHGQHLNESKIRERAQYTTRIKDKNTIQDEKSPLLNSRKLRPCFTDNTVKLRPVPWLTEGAISFLQSFLQQHKDAKILEFGTGASTVWFAHTTTNLVSVEHNPEWYLTVKKALTQPGCHTVNLILKEKPYYSICHDFPKETFDLILIDGRNRKGCILHSIPLLKRGGVLMLDNAERGYYKGGIDLLTTWKQFSAVQKKPDSCGFCYPGWTTSWWIKP